MLLLTFDCRPESKTRNEIQFHGDKHSKIEIEPLDPNRPSFDLVAIIDPLSQGAQKISATLSTLSKVINAKIRIFFNCVDKHSQMPQKSYFRLALDPELTFTRKNYQTQHKVLLEKTQFYVACRNWNTNFWSWS